MFLVRTALFMVVASALLFAVNQINLLPQVDRNLFFEKSDPQLRSSQRIQELFGRSRLVVLAVEGDTTSSAYMRRIEQISSQVTSIRGVRDVKSLVRGPDSVQAAKDGALWRRLLLFEDGTGGGSNVLIFLNGALLLPFW